MAFSHGSLVRGVWLLLIRCLSNGCDCHPLSDFTEVWVPAQSVPEQLRWVLTSVLLRYLPSFQIISKGLSVFLLYGFVIVLNFFLFITPFLCVLFSSVLSTNCFSRLYDCLFEFHERTLTSIGKEKIFQFIFSFSNFSTKNSPVYRYSQPLYACYHPISGLHYLAFKSLTWPPGQSPNTSLLPSSRDGYYHDSSYKYTALIKSVFLRENVSDFLWSAT